MVYTLDTYISIYSSIIVIKAEKKFLGVIFSTSWRPYPTKTKIPLSRTIFSKLTLNFVIIRRNLRKMIDFLFRTIFKRVSFNKLKRISIFRRKVIFSLNQFKWDFLLFRILNFWRKVIFSCIRFYMDFV